ncbi:MAG: hypothetical protein WD097_03210 [Balneolales bacterium]
MPQKNIAVFPFKILSDSVRAMDSASLRLLDVMKDQLDAIIASDAEQIMHLTEKIASAQQYLHKMEDAFIEELNRCMAGFPHGGKRITLEFLKTVYPDYSGYINEWQLRIAGNVSRLQQLQDRLLQLLQFARIQNSAMMRSVYTMGNANNIHYRQDGEKAGMISGIAVNHEG